MNTVLENSSLRLSVAEHGGELVSVWDKEKGVERIWSAQPEVWARHAPILFPFVGKVKEGSYRFDGREYSMTSHGFARDREFLCVEKTEDSVTHCLSSDEDTMGIYPFCFELYVTHRFAADDERKVEVKWRVVNKDNKELLYSIGGHPAFTFPEGVRGSQCRLLFEEGNKALAYHLLNEEGLLVKEKVYPLVLSGGQCAITEDMFDRDALVFLDSQIRRITLAGPEGKPYVRLSCEGFPYFGIWSKSVDRFLCLEPWYGVADLCGAQGSLEDKTGIQRLPAGGSRVYRYQMEFY